MKRPEDKPRNFHYIITEEDILEILIAMDNNDWDYVMDFFEDLEPLDVPRSDIFTLEQLVANAGLVLTPKRR
tara:strand:+ start:203 stop:418 length:216 start_codon:yes stop_codon:yes gene_type:complete